MERILGGLPMTQPLSDIPPVEEPILGGDVRSIFRPDETKLDKAKGLADAGLSLFGALVHGVPAQFMGKMGPEFQAKRFRPPQTPAGERYFETAAEALGKVAEAFPMQPSAFTSPANILAGPAIAQAGAKAADVNAMAQKALQAAGGRLEKAVEKQVYSTMEKGGLPAEILQGMTQNTASQVVKGKGGNWIERTVEQSVKPLKSETIAGETPAQRIPRHEELLKDPTLTPESRQTVERMLGQERQRAALDNWIDRNLVNYIKKEMGTPEDPVRKLAEEGITHKADLVEDIWGQVSLVPEKSTRVQRHMAGFPASGMGQSDLAKRWENLSDEAIASRTAGDIQRTIESLPFAQEAERRFKDKQSEIARRFDEKLRNSGIYSDKEMEVLNQKTPIGDKAIILQDNEYETLQNEWWKSHGMVDRINYELGTKNPWIMKLDPNTPLYTTTYGDLGFDHIVDVLREDLQTGRIRPEQLNKVSMEQAVKRAYEYDQEKAKEAARAAIQQQEGLPVVKEYPEGYKWLELHNKTDAKKTEEALSYEGRTMGHCVGSYCPEVLEGKTQIFSLRDSKGEPHVTIEVVPKYIDPRDWFFNQSDDVVDQIKKETSKQPTQQEMADVIRRHPKYQEDVANAPKNIVQIKGKGNQAPKEDYLPFVQDFVTSGNWSKINDVRNAGLRRYTDVFNDAEQRMIEALNLPVPDHHWLTGDQIQTLHNAIVPKGKRLKYDAYGNIKGEGFAKGGLVSDTDTIKTRLTEQGMPEDKAFMQALKLANEVQMADGGLVGAYQKYIGQPFANVAGPFARGLLGLEKPEYGEEQAYRTGQALSNMPGAGAPAGILKAATQAPEALKAAQMLPEMLGGLLGATVFHGSPYKFRKFDPTKIGSGEGAQSFGHGHYVADEEDVAKFYRDKLSDKPEVKIGGETIGTQAQSPESVVAARLASTYSSMAIRGTPKTEDVVGVIEEGLDRTLNHVAKTGNFKLYQDLMDQKAALGRMKDQGIEFQSTGSLYKIDLPDEQINKMLDWNKPLGQQKELKDVLNKIRTEIALPKLQDAEGAGFAYQALANAVGGQANASALLKQYGIPGIRYLDQGSRAAGKGTSNYVVFPGNEDLLKILERNNQPMAKGGLAGLKNLPAAARAAKSRYAEEAAAAARANPRSKQEIESIAQRIAEQTQPGFVRPDPAFSVNPEGKSRAVYELEQRTPMIVESTIEDKPLPTVDYEKQLGSVIVGVPGDPTMGQVKSPGSLYEPTRAGKRLMQVGDVTPETPVELYGGPSYGTTQPESYWASSKGAAQGIKNLVDEMAEKYQTDKILGQYMKMSPESSRYAMHNLDALISVRKPDKLPADKMEILNKMVREGDKANKYPQFVGFEDPIDLLLQAQMNPNLRKRISEVLEKPTTAKAVGFPFQGSVVQTAITEPGLRNLETGVTGYSVGQMRPQGELTLSRHPTYEYDIPGQLMGRSKYPIPYELAFPDFSQWFREHPELAKKVDPFNMLKSVGARQKVDPQYVDEIKMYEEAMKRLTGKKKGGKVTGLSALNRN